MEQLLFSPAEAAKLLNISRSQVYILLNEGRLKSVHIGRSRRITKDALISFVEDLEKNHNQPPMEA